MWKNYESIVNILIVILDTSRILGYIYKTSTLLITHLVHCLCKHKILTMKLPKYVLPFLPSATWCGMNVDAKHELTVMVA